MAGRGGYLRRRQQGGRAAPDELVVVQVAKELVEAAHLAHGDTYMLRRALVADRSWVRDVS